MRLHGDVCVQMVKRTICLLATVPSALVHALNLFVPPARAFVLLSTRDWNERVDLPNASVKSQESAQAKIT